MRPLCASTLLLLSLPLAARPLRAQEQWNDERTTTLVRAAITRRSIQLADTGLRDYTARAHGYVTFLAQLGDGFPLPPAVIKSDELMVEVYWSAPDRSKQRVIGRRDTLLLPTDIAYHRDHLGVVQNNFPAIIRLGDGEEVRDVPHPLSAAGLAVYDYAIADSLSIRAGTRAFDVVMVKVRPKDDRVPAAVGAVYIDRESATIVRMTFSFTRAALKDPQLEDVSVILENGLVDGAFWLPRRQEIEIRRSVTWMDFPARGIIRGRWEICCVEANVGLAPRTFTGPEIVEAPREEQRRFAFEGSVLGGLPEEVRAFDAEEVRRVQEDARDLVRAAALARAKRAIPSARAFSDLLRVDRAEGLALGAGASRALGGGFDLRAFGRYGTADHRWKGRGALGWRGSGGTSITLAARDDLAEAGEVPEVSGLRNSVAAQEFGADWTDPYGVSGPSLSVGTMLTSRLHTTLEVARERQWALSLRAIPASGAFEPLLAADEVRVDRATLGYSVLPATGGGGATWRSSGSLTFANAGDAIRYVRASVDVEAAVPVGAWQLTSRTVAAGVSAGPAVPLQALVRFGGPITGPGYGFHSIEGRAGVSQRIELGRRIPFVPLRLGRFGRAPSSLVLAPYVHGASVTSGNGEWEWRPSAGFAVTGLFDLVRLDLARGLNDGRWLFSVDLSRTFWPAL